MLTNVLSPLHCNFSEETIPFGLKGAPYFLLNNPVALQKKCLALKDAPGMNGVQADMCKAVNDSEQNALGTLVALFDWLDGLEPQPTMAMCFLHDEPQTVEGMIANVLGPMGQVVTTKERNPVSLHNFCFKFTLVEWYERSLQLLEDNQYSTREAKARVRPELFLYCTQLQFHLLYANVPRLSVDRNSTSLDSTRAVFQVHPPLLVPCSCTTPAESRKYQQCYGLRKRQAAAACRRLRWPMAFGQSLSARGGGNPAAGTELYVHGGERSESGAAGEYAR
jgi:hypothetical protein